jgi:glycosyltransferase involved in cell wall biosynthesis
MERSQTVLPLKVFLYMAAGRAILAPRRGDVEEVLTDGLTARLVAPGDGDGAARALQLLLDDGGLRAGLAENALSASVQYTWAGRARRIVEFLEACASPGLGDRGSRV